MTALVEIGSVVSRVESWNPKQKAPEEMIDYIDIASVDKEAKSICGVSTFLGKEAPSRARQIVQVGDVLVSTVRPNLNAVAFVSEEYDGATASTGYCVLRPEPNKCNGRFLFHWVKTSTFVGEMVKLATGANYPAVSDRIVKSSKIPLPPLPEQRRIAAILDKADAIRRKRQKAIRLTEEFLRSVFLDMFGDPVLNPKGWPQVPIRGLGTVTTGNTPPRKIEDNYGDYIEWIKSDNINTPQHFLTKSKEMLSEKGAEIGRVVPKKSILVTCIAGSPACIGNAALADRDVAFNQQINVTIQQNSS